jgi:hypothetical protein
VALAAEDSIRASGFGLRVAMSLWRLGWPDDAIVFTLATLRLLRLPLRLLNLTIRFQDPRRRPNPLNPA